MTWNFLNAALAIASPIAGYLAVYIALLQFDHSRKADAIFQFRIKFEPKNSPSQAFGEAEVTYIGVKPIFNVSVHVCYGDDGLAIELGDNLSFNPGDTWSQSWTTTETRICTESHGSQVFLHVASLNLADSRPNNVRYWAYRVDASGARWKWRRYRCQRLRAHFRWNAGRWKVMKKSKSPVLPGWPRTVVGDVELSSRS